MNIVESRVLQQPWRRPVRGGHRAVWLIVVVTAGLLVSPLAAEVKGRDCAQQPPARTDGEASETADRQIAEILAAKAQRTFAQRKVGSRLLDAWRALRDQPGSDELVKVDIRADVTPSVLECIKFLGGTVIASVPRYRAIRARLPLSAVERLAALDEIQWIRSADKAATSGGAAETQSGAEAGVPETVGSGTANRPENEGDHY